MGGVVECNEADTKVIQNGHDYAELLTEMAKSNTKNLNFPSIKEDEFPVLVMIVRVTDERAVINRVPDVMVAEYFYQRLLEKEIEEGKCEHDYGYDFCYDYCPKCGVFIGEPRFLDDKGLHDNDE